MDILVSFAGSLLVVFRGLQKQNHSFGAANPNSDICPYGILFSEEKTQSSERTGSL